MTIDTKRLETDAAYWDKCGAPEGATQYDRDADLFCCEKGYWVGARFTHYMNGQPQSVSGRFIPRPTAPAAPERDGGADLEPGTWVEVQRRGSDWPECFYIGRDENGLRWFKEVKGGEEFEVFGSSMPARPLRTKEQRQREELIELIGKQRPTIAELADAILSRYNLEPKL